MTFGHLPFWLRADLASTTIQVVDANHRPVADVLVRPRELHTERPKGMVANPWGKPWAASGASPKEAITTKNGFATFHYPKQVDSLRVESISVYISHPDYSTINRRWGGRTPLILPKEPLVTIRAVAPAGVELFETAVQHTWDSRDDSGYVVDWTRHEDGCSASARLPRGQYLMRSVSRTRTGGVLFGDPRRVEIPDVPRLELEFNAQPALTVHGQLHHTVPRPILDGEVLVDVTSYETYPSDTLKKRYFNLLRRLSAQVTQEGTFVLPGLPLGEMTTIVARCDGYLFNARDGREALPNTTDKTLLLPMGPSGSAVVTVLDSDEKPVEGVSVFFKSDSIAAGSDGRYWHLGDKVDSVEWLFRKTSALDWGCRDASQVRKPEGELPFSGQTNKSGVIVLHGLRPGPAKFTIMDREYELPVDRVTERGESKREVHEMIRPHSSIAVTLRLQRRSQKSKAR